MDSEQHYEEPSSRQGSTIYDVPIAQGNDCQMANLSAAKKRKTLPAPPLPPVSSMPAPPSPPSTPQPLTLPQPIPPVSQKRDPKIGKNRKLYALIGASCVGMVLAMIFGAAVLAYSLGRSSDTTHTISPSFTSRHTPSTTATTTTTTTASSPPTTVPTANTTVPSAGNTTTTDSTGANATDATWLTTINSTHSASVSTSAPVIIPELTQCTQADCTYNVSLPGSHTGYSMKLSFSHFDLHGASLKVFEGSDQVPGSPCVLACPDVVTGNSEPTFLRLELTANSSTIGSGWEARMSLEKLGPLDSSGSRRTPTFLFAICFVLITMFSLG